MTFLDGLPRLFRRSFFRKTFSVLVLLLVLVSSFSFLAVVVPDDAGLEDASEVPARSATITTSQFAISPKTAYVGDTITFFANATSDTGTTLTFTIYYDNFLVYDTGSRTGTVNPDSPVSVNTTGNPGKIVTQFVYDAPGPCGGNYYVNVSINDNTGAPVKNVTRYVTVMTFENLAPYFAPDLGSSLPAEIGVQLNMSVTCFDLDNDDLTLTWDFGDGTDQVIQTTGPALAGVECTLNHTWNPDPALWYGVGDTNITYYVNLSLTDGMGHWVNTSTLIRIPLDHNFTPGGHISASTTTVDPGDTVMIYGTAHDEEGEPLTWTYLFSNSTGAIIHIDVYHTGLTEPNATVFQNTTYAFSEPGNYTVTLYLTDLALPELQVDPDFAAHNVSVGNIKISSVLNRVPYVLATIKVKDFYTGRQDVSVNETTGVAIAVFTIETNDRDGEIVYATWDFGDGSEAGYNQSGGGTQMYTFVQMHEYPASGQFNVSVVVTDGRLGHEVLRYRLVNITSNNSSPDIRGLTILLSNSSYGLPGSVVSFVLLLFDLERDPLEVRWDFGDGSPVEWTNVTSFSEEGLATCLINHTYSEIGRYNVWINYTDGIYGLNGLLHQESWCALVVISTKAPMKVRYWDWWDYASITIFAASIGLLVLWAVMGSVKRSRLDMIGTTMEEYLLRKQELDKYDERHKGGEGLG